MKEGLNKETLKRLYLKEGKSLATIAKMFGCSVTKVRYRCIKYGIKRRPSAKKIIIKKSVLQKLYVIEGKPLNEIEERLSCYQPTIHKRCKEYGIPLRIPRIEGITQALLQKLYVKEGKTIRDVARILNCSRETVRRKCKQFGIKLRPIRSRIMGVDKSALQRLYVKEGKSLSKIAEMFLCSPTTVRNRCREYGTKIRGGRAKRIKE